MNVIEVENLTKQIDGQKILTDISLQVPKNSIYGLLGPNGAGKSTTMKILIGLLKASSGKVQLFGSSINNNNDYLKDIGILIEEPAFYGNLTAYENLRILQQLAKVPSKNIDEVLRIVDLSHAKHKQVKKFSLGMKQRLGIAIALLKFPKLLILDEPTNGLDPEGIHEMRDLIKSLPQKYDMTVLISSHLLSEIEQTCDYVGIINKGNTVYEAAMAEINQNSKTIFTLENTQNLGKCQELANYQYTIDENKCYFNTIEPSEISQINKLLVENGYQVYQIKPEEQHLESIFLQKVGESNV